MTIDIDEVRSALSTRAVLDLYGWTAKRSGDELESSACPTRSDHSRRAFVINANSGRWQCFAGDTRVITYDGVFEIGALATSGTTHRMLVPSSAVSNITGADHSGRWADVEVRSFGRQRLYDVTVTRNSVRKVIRTTAGHRWFTQRRPNAPRKEVVTSELRPGDRLAVLTPQTLRQRAIAPSSFGIAHGFTFGDGNKNGNSVEVVLWGEKDEQMLPFFYGRVTGTKVIPDSGVVGKRIGGLPKFFKTLPSLGESPAYLVGFLAGYFAADGCVDELGHPKLACAYKSVLQRVQTICTRVGIVTHGITMQMRVGRSGDRQAAEATPLYSLSFARGSLSADFFVLRHHRERFEANSDTYDRLGWKVVDIKPSTTEEVFCAVVPGEAAFTLEDNILTGNCFPCGTSGDLFDFIAAAERLSMPGDFAAVLAKAAEIAGVGPSAISDEERKRRRDQWRAAAAERERAEREQRRARDAAAVPTATAHWESLLSGHPRGYAYLVERRVDEVSEFEDTVRFDPAHAGSPAIALYARDGAIRNVVTRRVPELGEPKTPGLRDCPTAGTLINAVCQIEHGRDVILTEGVMDSLTARLAWPAAIVLGAHGAGNLHKIAKLAAPAIVAAKTRLLIVPHHDRRGWETAMHAAAIAVEAGLSVRRGTLAIVKHGAKDLNEAWKGGWRCCP